ncbi:hypothetical protein ACTNBL_01685 [Enterococcus villorum]|uniref:Lipoprotein n=2 Tax=Enterococcus villorum TaxID=112904 RepID=A0A511J2V1_9ENTE|nr:hypothetical protein [Enterococcus villorum]EOH92135.1 hypothetical protein UAO_00585 [Enterococcus villorum ATCC 700913]EOW76631.1 hypothetical protein I591_01939 [Enterococcus villorum ATCC 700913]GEL92320.1 hypothetical protein EVI01_16570 [Enterococcus villorum]
MKKLGLLLISSVFLFVGCGTKNVVAKYKSVTTETSIQTSSTVSSSSHNKASSSKSTVTSKSSSSNNETVSSESASTENSQPAVNNTQMSSTTQTTTENSTVTNEFPYAVDPGQFNIPTTFQFRGANVPASVTLENNNGQMTMTSNPKSGGEPTVYTASIETIPTTSIRISSYAGNTIRTVKVNTKINLLNKLSSANTSNEYSPFYVFKNSNGGLSLITPNYAGNAPEGQSDVMLEAVH